MGSKKKTNFDRYLEGRLRDPAMAERFRRAGKFWDQALRSADDVEGWARWSAQQLAKVVEPEDFADWNPPQKPK